MNRKLLVTLLHKNIEELTMITEGFMEMTDYPQAIIQLAKRKTEDIQTIINELSGVKASTENIRTSPETAPAIAESEPVKEVFVTEPEPVTATVEPEVIFETEEIHPTPAPQETPEIEIVPETIEAVVETETVTEQTLGIEIKITETTESTTAEVKKHSEEQKKITIADKIATHSTSRNELLSNTDKSLSNTLANKKITDIKQAISIGDRFRFQRELFKSNGEDMNKTLSYLNQLATLDEAMSFLKSKYSWDDNNEAADDFYQIVKRKFV